MEDIFGGMEDKIKELFFACMEEKMKPYDGSDPNTDSHNSCNACHKHGQTKKDFPDHKDECKTIKLLGEEMDEERTKLGAVEPMFGGPPLNYFDEQVGHFWGLIETRDYCRKRHDLMRKLYMLAYYTETVEAWERVLGHQLELLRLIRRDNLGVRFTVSFTLLYLNRDDDCMDFIRHWYCDAGGDDGVDLDSSPGDWLYGRTPNASLMDIFAQHPTIDPTYTSLAFLVAILIVKLRIVAVFDAREKSFSLFKKTKMVKILDSDALGAVRTALVGDLKVKAKQNRQIDHVINFC